ncbi:MAG: carboxypeptidase regulatory-like domain-containing protein [Planctomycetota bacterium]
MRSSSRSLWLCAVLLAWTCGPAWAHKLNVFARAEGKALSGYAYFPGGGRATGLKVQALAPDGTVVGEATTDDQGEFTIPVTARCDYEVVAETLDGHRATFPVPARDLPDGLPPYGGGPTPAPTTSADASPVSPTTSVAVTGPDDELAALVEAAVRKQVRPLREQIEGYEQRRRLHDIIGGIGYIVGVAGIAFYFLGARRAGGRRDGPTG